MDSRYDTLTRWPVPDVTSIRENALATNERPCRNITQRNEDLGSREKVIPMRVPAMCNRTLLVRLADQLVVWRSTPDGVVNVKLISGESGPLK